MTLRATFLGTSGAVPTTARNTSAVLVQREGDRLLFDCGEGTQRQMMRFSTGFNVVRIFLTHTHGDHVLGLPGLLQTCDFNDRQEPIIIHTPQGTRRTIENLVTATGTRPSYPVRVAEVESGDVAFEAESYEVRVFATDHRATSVGYALVEEERKGRFDRERAEELGVPVGPKFSTLHAGEAIKLEDGTVISPEQVVGEPRPGRTIVYTGDTRPTGTTVEVAEHADLLVHDATFADDRRDRAETTGHSTATQAAEIANRAGVKCLALTHVSSRYAGQETVLEQEARKQFAGEAFLPDDGDEVEIPFPDE